MQYDRIIAFDRGGGPLSNEFVLRNLRANIKSHIGIDLLLYKRDSLDYIIVAHSMTLQPHLLNPKDAEFSRITQNNGHYAVQGHSRSPILVPI